MTGHMTDDLTRPLGIKEGEPRGFGRHAIVAAAVLLVAGSAFAGWWFLQARPVLVAQSPVGSAAPADEPANAERRPQRQERREVNEARDGSPATIIPAEPTGSIVPLNPLPEMRRQEIGLAHLPDPDFVERIGNYVLPKRSADNLRPMDVYSRQPATEGNFGVARVVLIVGGLGISQTGTQDAIQRLPPDVTLAFAPYGNSLSRWMQDARKAGHELLLQLPMEPFDYPSNNPGAQTLRTDLEADDNIANLNWLLSRITNYVGVMGYLGGKFLSDETAMKPVFDELAKRGLLFVDDGSVRNSVSNDMAANSLVPYAKSVLQVDSIRNRAKIREKLDELAETAKRTGIAIGFANAFDESIAMIADFARDAAQRGIEITPVSAVVDDPERRG